jgi:hypothetical protein
MSRLLSAIALILTGPWLCGCASSPWSAPTSALPGTLPAAQSTASPASPSAASPQPDPQKMQAVMAELRQLGALDPAAQDRLLEDLRQSDPSLWPLVIEQFRATMAYRQRAMARTATADRAERLPPVSDVAVVPIEAPSGQYPQTPDPPRDAAPPVGNRAESDPRGLDCGAGVSPAVVRANETAPLPPAGETPAPQKIDERISALCASRAPSQVVRASAETDMGSGPVFQKATSPPTSSNWRLRLAGAIEALEAEAPKNPATPAELAEHARLRMLYAAAGRREDALRPIPAASPAASDFLSKELEGLTTWLNVDQTPNAARRAAETKPALVEALSKLAESAPLAVCNLAFCTEVQSYGCLKRFEKYAFQPNQEVLLYAEVENFTAEPTPKGHHTSLKSSYQILDARGQRVAEHAFAPTEEYCQNVRRDFFIGYHLRLPKGASPGKYVLQLSIEDLTCQKVGRASIEFEMKAEGGKEKGEGGRAKGEAGP